MMKGSSMKPGDLVRDLDGDIGVIVKIVPDEVYPAKTWLYYLVGQEIFSDDMDNFEMIIKDYQDE